MNNLRIGSPVNLYYWRDEKVHLFVIIDILFEHFLDGYKTMVKARYYSEKSQCWFIETFHINDFFNALKKANEIENDEVSE